MSGLTVTNWVDLQNSPSEHGSWAVTIGVFDGLHLGHLKLINEIVSGPEYGLLVTFQTNPKFVLRPHNFLGQLMTWNSKLDFCEKLGVKEILAIDFSPEFSMMGGESFIRVLLQNYRIKRFVLGKDFAFGHEARANVETLKAWVPAEVQLTLVESVHVGGIRVSSTAVREAVQSGKMDRVRRFLGRPYKLEVPTGATYKNGLWSVPMTDWQQIVPKIGKYAVTVGGKVGHLIVEKEVACWESPPGATNKEIIFKE